MTEPVLRAETAEPTSKAPSFPTLDAGDTISAVSAVISLIGMVVSIVFSRRSSANAQRANDLSEQMLMVARAQSENDIRNSISAAMESVRSIVKEIEDYVGTKTKSQFNAGEKRELERKRERLKAAVEAELSRYDVACRQYLEGKIESTSFRIDYHSEIRRICETENQPYPELRKHRDISKFKCLWDVYLEMTSSEGAVVRKGDAP